MRVSVIGQRKVQESPELVFKVYETLFDLIENQGADTFYFGSKTLFSTLCLNAVLELQKLYPSVRTVYVRATCKNLEKSYKDCLLETDDAAYFPTSVRDFKNLNNELRDVAMIEACDVLLTYCDPSYRSPRKTPTNKTMAPIEATKKSDSGAQMAVDFARKRKKRIINLF